MCCLKVLRVAACLQLAERMFQSFALLNEKDFLPLSVRFFGTLRSVDVLRSLYEDLFGNQRSVDVLRSLYQS